MIALKLNTIYVFFIYYLYRTNYSMAIPADKYRLIFRYRNSNRFLEEIEFIVNYPTEEPIDVAEAMARHNFLRGRDADALASNIKRLLKSTNLFTEPIYFPLHDSKQLLNMGEKGWETQKKLKRGYGCLFIANDYLKRMMDTFRLHK